MLSRLSQPASRASLPIPHHHHHLNSGSSSRPWRRRAAAAAAVAGDGSTAGGSSSGDASRSSAWGSSWSKRPASVFKQQQQQASTPPPSRRCHPPQQQPDPALEASIRANVDRAAETLQDIVQEVLGELLVEEASAYVLGQAQADVQLHEAVRGAVVKRLEWLDANFLAGVNAYLTLPSVRDNPELTDLLTAVRQQTLELVSARLPAPVQVLNAALAQSRRSERADVVQCSLSGGRGDVPGSSLDALGAAAHQLIDDMEDQQVVADRVLLARLVLLREELRVLAEQQSATDFWQAMNAGDSTCEEGAHDAAATAPPGPAASPSSQPFFAFHRSNLPARCAAFLKNLLSVQDRTARLGLLSKTFQEDWIAESPPSASSSSSNSSKDGASSSGRSRLRDTSFEQPTESPDIVRPGRLLTTLHAMRQELEVQLAQGGVDNPASGEALVLLQRLDAIKLEALVALDRVQHARPVVAVAAGGLDYEVDLQAADADARAMPIQL